MSTSPDVFSGVEGRVPAGLADALRELPLIDHHVHGHFTRPLTRPEFEAALNEASTDPVPDFMTQLDSMVGLAVRRWCAPLLGLSSHATSEEYLRARGERSVDELAATFLHAAGVERWLVDTGIVGTSLAAPDDVARASGGRTGVIVRLETLIESMLDDALSPAEFPAALRQRLDDALGSVAGVKTVAAYRCGFDVDWSPPSDAEAARAFADSPPRVSDPRLIAFAVHAAAERGLPLQVHAGFGDRDLDLNRADPLLLLPLLRSMAPTPVLLLHCYPFHRNAGYLAQAFDHVHFDIGLAVNFLGPRAVDLVGESLELAPFAKQLYSSDAYGLPELHFLGALLWRRAMGLVLGEWVRRTDCSEQDAVHLATLIGAGNARRVYGL